jgi:hypothetical protein
MYKVLKRCTIDKKYYENDIIEIEVPKDWIDNKIVEKIETIEIKQKKEGKKNG